MPTSSSKCSSESNTVVLTHLSSLLRAFYKELTLSLANCEVLQTPHTPAVPSPVREPVPGPVPGLEVPVPGAGEVLRAGSDKHSGSDLVSYAQLLTLISLLDQTSRLLRTQLQVQQRRQNIVTTPKPAGVRRRSYIQ